MLLRCMLLSSLLLMTTSSVQSFNVLGLFPHPGVSHFYFFHPIMRELARQGHHVTVISHFPDKNPPPNYTDLPLTGMDIFTNTGSLESFANRNKYIDPWFEFLMLAEWGATACENALNSTAVQKVLSSGQHFDVIIMEQFNTDCLMGLAYKLQAPVIGLSSCSVMPWHNDRMGNPNIPSYIPSLFMSGSDRMSFGERIANWLMVNSMQIFKVIIMDRDSDRLIMQYLGDNIPSVSELVKATSALFVNQHYSLSGVKPLTPSVVEIGGLHIQEAKPLEPTLKAYLDASEQGVIYISWGSIIRSESLPSEKREAIQKALSSLKQNVVWKWENETMINKPDNVFIQKWMPQRDILCHPNVRVFVSHGGLMGSSEAAHCGVPVVVTPIDGDQFLNAAALVERGMGHIVTYEDISVETMTDAIRFALDPKTQENAKKVQFAYTNRQNSAMETAVWWVEHVVATGGVPLSKSNAVFMSSIAYHSLDVYAFFALSLISILVSWVWVLRRFCGSRSTRMTTKLKST